MGKQKIQVLSNISLLLVAIIWGSGFVASQMALDANLSSAFIMFVRFAIATIIIGVVFYKDLKANMKGTFKGRYRNRTVFVFGVLCSDRWITIYDSIQ